MHWIKHFFAYPFYLSSIQTKETKGFLQNTAGMPKRNGLLATRFQVLYIAHEGTMPERETFCYGQKSTGRMQGPMKVLSSKN